MAGDDRGSASGADRAAQERDDLRHRSGMEGESNASRQPARSEGLAPRASGSDSMGQGRGGTSNNTSDNPANNSGNQGTGMARTEGTGTRGLGTPGSGGTGGTGTGGAGGPGGAEGRPKARRGFAAMDPEKQREIARKGGRASGGRPENLRGVDRQAAGRKGGQAVVNKYGPQHMAEIGRKGGRSSGGFTRDGGRASGLDAPASPTGADAEGQGTETAATEADRPKRLDRFGNPESEGEAAAGST